MRNLAVRTELFVHLDKDLDIEELVDPSENTPAVIGYGNKGPSHPIGSNDHTDTQVGESIQVINAKGVYRPSVTEAWGKWEEHYRLAAKEKAKREELRKAGIR